MDARYWPSCHPFQADEKKLMHDESLHEMHDRQVRLPEIGLAGQQALAKARVLVIGAGGLGCPALLYLAAAGVGCLGIADADRVSVSNLHRQVLYGPADIGSPKVEVAARSLNRTNPSIRILPIPEKIVPKNAMDWIRCFDFVIDGSDNFPTRYLVSDACALLEKPLVFGSVFRFEGQLGVFNVPKDGITTNYRDLFPVPPGPDEAPDCATTGVIGMSPGIIGTWQAAETVKLITGAGEPLCNQLLTVDLLYNRHYLAQVIPDPKAQSLRPRSTESLQAFDYGAWCGEPPDAPLELDPMAFEAMRGRPGIRIVDLREPFESPQIMEFDHLRITMRELALKQELLEGPGPIIFFCQHGIRSAHAAAWALDALPGTPIHHLKGGILAWKHRFG